MTISRLDAINTCLRGIGASPVASEDDPDLDAATAGVVVDEVATNLQQQGFWFNEEYDWRLTANTLGEVSTPNTAIAVIPIQGNRKNELSIRNHKLYDMVHHTFDMTDRLVDGVITVSFIMDLPFENLPPVARTAVQYTARRLFAQDLEVDKTRYEMQLKDEQRAMAFLEREERKHRKSNYLRDNSFASNVIHTIGGPNSRFHGSATFPKRNSSGVI